MIECYMMHNFFCRKGSNLTLTVAVLEGPCLWAKDKFLSFQCWSIWVSQEFYLQRSISYVFKEKWNFLTALCLLVSCNLPSCCSVPHLYPTLCNPMDWYSRLPCPSPSPGVCSYLSIKLVIPSNYLISVIPFSSTWRSWSWTGRPGVLQFMGSQRVGHNWATEMNWT